MKSIKTNFLVFISIIILLFSSCQNGVEFDPSEVAYRGTNNEIPDDGDGDGELPEDEDPPEVGVGTGSHSFTLDFAPTADYVPLSVPENFQFRPLQVKYAGITDTTGEGIEVTYQLSIDVPDTLEVTPPPVDGDPETPPVDGEQAGRVRSLGESTPPPTLVDGDQDITATIEAYVNKENKSDEFVPIAYFIDNAKPGDTSIKEVTFTPERDTVTLKIIYPTVATVQRGILSIKFSSDNFNTVYKGTMPRELGLSVYSQGTTKTSRVVSGELKEQTDDTAVEIFKPENDYILTIKDPELPTGEKVNYKIPLEMKLYGVLNGYDVKVDVKKDSGKDLAVSDIKINDGIVKFTATHSGTKQLKSSEGTVTLTVDARSEEHKKIYIGLPFDIVIKTKRDETFKYYINNYVGNFDVSKGTSADFENGYFTELTINSMDILEATTEDKITYEIFRKDDSSDDFKSILKHTVSANHEFVFKDRHALILRNPEQDYKIQITHDTCTNNEKCISVYETAPSQKGSRMLTNRELFLAAMDSIRFALIDKDVHNLSGIEDQTRETKSGNGGKFHHNYDYRGIEGVFWYPYSYIHTYTISTYKPHFLTLGGKFTYASDDTDFKSINTVWDNGHHEKAPFTGTVTFTSPYGNGSITFDKIDISNYSWASPDWSKNFTVTVGNGKPVTYKKGEVPFGFYMTDSEFLTAVNAANYTQK